MIALLVFRSFASLTVSSQNLFDCSTHIRLIARIFFFLNPLMAEFFFRQFFSIKLKRGSYRLLTHRRGAHRNLLRSLLKIKFKIWSKRTIWSFWVNKRQHITQFDNILYREVEWQSTFHVRAHAHTHTLLPKLTGAFVSRVIWFQFECFFSAQRMTFKSKASFSVAMLLTFARGKCFISRWKSRLGESCNVEEPCTVYLLSCGVPDLEL